jgi:hypothetical protein
MIDKPRDEHEARVHESFDSLHAQVGERLDDAGRGAIEKLRAAAVAKDGAALRAGLNELRQPRLALPGARRAPADRESPRRSRAARAVAGGNRAHGRDWIDLFRATFQAVGQEDIGGLYSHEWRRQAN